MKGIILLIGLLLSSSAYACRPSHIPTIEELAASADLIFPGLVTGIELVELEKINKSHILNKPYDRDGGPKIAVYEHPIYKVMPMRALKGQIDKPIYVRSGNVCHGRVVELYETAVFFVYFKDEIPTAIIRTHEDDVSGILKKAEDALKNANKALKEDADNKNSAS